jgi:translocator protein
MDTQVLIPSLQAFLTPVALLAAVASAAVTGVLFEPGAWYRTLRKPLWTPPDWLFPIAWTLLYLAMALAAWLVATSGSPLAFAGLALWCWQLVLNTAWSPVVFGLRRLGTGLMVIALLWVAVAATAWMFVEVRPVAGWLMLPYLVWVSFAAVLNFALWWLNRRGPGFR